MSTQKPELEAVLTHYGIDTPERSGWVKIKCPLHDDSHASALLEYPHYTRPPVYRGYPVPEVLLSGHHAEVDRWRRRESLRRTRQRRPDLLARADLSPADREFLAQLEAEEE